MEFGKYLKALIRTALIKFAEDCPRVEAGSRPREHAATAEEARWAEYLAGLSSRRLSPNHAKAVVSLWQALRAEVPDLPVPVAGLTDDATFQIAWDRGRFHLDVDVARDGTIEWFYADRDSPRSDSGEAASVTPASLQHLTAYLRAQSSEAMDKTWGYSYPHVSI